MDRGANEPREAAQQRRAELLAGEDMLDDDVVREVLAAEPRELREAGRLLGLWDAAGSRFLYPTFQVDGPTCAIRRGVSELLAVLPRDPSGWQHAFWLFQPHVRLEGLTPAAALASNARLVLEAARESIGPDGTNW
jgi:hypothetical protein